MLTQERLAVVDTQRDTLFVDLSHIAHELSALWPLHRTLQGCQNLSKELLATVGTNTNDPLKHFEAISDYFFKQKKFKPLKSKPTLEKYLLPYTLLSRRGPVELLLPLFVGLNHQLNLNVQVAHYGQEIIIKLIVEGKAHFFNFKKACEQLNSEDLITLVNSGCDCSQTVSEQEILTKYLLRIKHQCMRERSLLSLYKIQTYLMKYQPFALNHILDRARAAYAIGDIVKAAEDVSQYLTFSADRINNTRMIKLMRKMNHHSLLRRFHD
ncbi:MAG: hypothetical protein IT287_04595 [Bdellovibrionaceae bacterium]|nr:hypothetical protein [Pseudobdellovibrionaceae bacterium]